MAPTTSHPLKPMATATQDNELCLLQTPKGRGVSTANDVEVLTRLLSPPRKLHENEEMDNLLSPDKKVDDEARYDTIRASKEHDSLSLGDSEASKRPFVRYEGHLGRRTSSATTVSSDALSSGPVSSLTSPRGSEGSKKEASDFFRPSNTPRHIDVEDCFDSGKA